MEDTKKHVFGSSDEPGQVVGEIERPTTTRESKMNIENQVPVDDILGVLKLLVNNSDDGSGVIKKMFRYGLKDPHIEHETPANKSHRGSCKDFLVDTCVCNALIKSGWVELTNDGYVISKKGLEIHRRMSMKEVADPDEIRNKLIQVLEEICGNTSPPGFKELIVKKMFPLAE